MATLQGHFICSLSSHPKLTGSCVFPTVGSLKKIKLRNNAFWGCRGFIISNGRKKSMKDNKVVQCSFKSSSDGDDRTAENFNENDDEYVNSSVIEAGTKYLI